MSLSGILVSEDAKTAYQSFLNKNRKNSVKITYITFKLSDDMKEIVVDKQSDSAKYEDFLEQLPKDEPRWAVYDLDYEDDGRNANKIIFFSWSPDVNEENNAGGKLRRLKMQYASSQGAFSFIENATRIQATDSDEVEYQTVCKKAAKK